jgi:hypothetical protein
MREIPAFSPPLGSIIRERMEEQFMIRFKFSITMAAFGTNLESRCGAASSTSAPVASHARVRTIRTKSGFAGLVIAALFWALLEVPAYAQSNEKSSWGVGNIHEGLVIGVVVGATAVVGVGITYLVLHNRGVTTGCIVESGGKMTLVSSDKKAYFLADPGPPLPVGERVKLKGYKSGAATSPSLRVEKILKDYGHCRP